MIEPPHILTTTTFPMARLYAKVPAAEVPEQMGKLVRELLEGIAAQGACVAGPWFTHHFRRPQEFFDFEVCMPVTAGIQPHGRVVPGLWPAMRVVRTIYHGPYEGLRSAWAEFMAWIGAEQLIVTEEIWERYLVNPHTEPDAARWRTELNRPLDVGEGTDDASLAR